MSHYQQPIIVVPRSAATRHVLTPSHSSSLPRSAHHSLAHPQPSTGTPRSAATRHVITLPTSHLAALSAGPSEWLLSEWSLRWLAAYCSLSVSATTLPPVRGDAGHVAWGVHCPAGVTYTTHRYAHSLTPSTQVFPRALSLGHEQSALGHSLNQYTSTPTPVHQHWSSTRWTE